MRKAGNEISKSSLLKKAGENPFALVLIGAGIGLLAFGSSNRRGDGNHRNYRGKNFAATDRRESNDSTLKTAQKKIGEAYDNVTQTAGDVYASAGDAANRSYEKVGEYGTQFRDAYNRRLEENPMAIGAAALAIGAIIGLAIPLSRYENSLMGETRQNLLQKVQDSANELVDKVKDVASEAGRTISAEVKNQETT